MQAAEGTSFGLLPCVPPIVDAGGFYTPLDTLPFQAHAGYLLFWALMHVCHCWEDKGDLLPGPTYFQLLMGPP